MELKNMIAFLQTLEEAMDETMRIALERRAVEIFEKRRRERHMTVDALAAKLYPELPIQNARMHLNRLRLPQVTGKPKRLLYGDFIDMCMALELPPERVLAQTIIEIAEQQ